jgi:predicted transcriptional regulator
MEKLARQPPAYAPKLYTDCRMSIYHLIHYAIDNRVYYDRLEMRFIQIDLRGLILMEKYKLYDAEYKFTSIIWDNEPINSTELVRLVADKLGWKKSTTYTVLKKLCDRGILQNRDAVVTALVKREDVQKYESKAVVEKSFGGSLPKFLTAFLGERKITEQEAEELKQIIEEAVK